MSIIASAYELGVFIIAYPCLEFWRHWSSDD